MRKNILFKIVFFTFSVVINAQPVLTAADFAFGQEVRYFRHSSAIGFTSTQPYSIPFAITITSYPPVANDCFCMTIPLSSVPNAANFPNATSAIRCTNSSSQSYELYETTSLTHKLIASGNDNSLSPENTTFYNFPLEYTFFPATDYQSYGSITSPSGIYPNVIKIHKTTMLPDFTQKQENIYIATNPYKILEYHASYGGNGGSYAYGVYYEYLPYSLNNETFKNNSISVFPNPTHGDIQIFNSNYVAGELFSIVYDLLGKEVLPKQQITSEIQTINSTSFANGLYILKITNKENQVLQTKKIIKN